MKMTKVRGVSGGGIEGNKNVRVGVKAGPPRVNTTSAAGAAQIGVSVAFAKDQVNAISKAQPVRFGNEIATNVGRGGPGTGRTVMPCGSQGMHGALVGTRPAATTPDLLAPFGP